MSQCQMGVYCSEHGFIHGAEANELRERIEVLIAAGSGGSSDCEDLLVELQEVLAGVDAVVEQHLNRAPTTLTRVDESTPAFTSVLVIEDTLLMDLKNSTRHPTGVMTKTWTRSKPWTLGHGELVVLLVGRTGGYLASRCFVLAPPATKMG